MSHAPTRRALVARKPVRRAHRHATGPAPAAIPATVAAQRCGAPQDEALYSCHCGCNFHAAVSTAVDCPACGTAQDW